MSTHPRAAEWALKRHLDGKSKLSPYQLRNIMKAINSASSTTKQKDNKNISMMSKDLDKLKKITNQANEILQKYK